MIENKQQRLNEFQKVEQLILENREALESHMRDYQEYVDGKRDNISMSMDRKPWSCVLNFSTDDLGRALVSFHEIRALIRDPKETIDLFLKEIQEVEKNFFERYPIVHNPSVLAKLVEQDESLDKLEELVNRDWGSIWWDDDREDGDGISYSIYALANGGLRLSTDEVPQSAFTPRVEVDILLDGSGYELCTTLKSGGEEFFLCYDIDSPEQVKEIVQEMLRELAMNARGE